MEITMKWWLSWSNKSKICYRGLPGGGWRWWFGGWPMGIFCINNRFWWNKGWPGGWCDHGLTKAGEFWEAYHRKDEDENRIDDDESNDDEDGVTKAGGFGGAGHHRAKDEDDNNDKSKDDDVDDGKGVTKAGGFGGAGHHQHPFLALRGLSAATAKQN